MRARAVVAQAPLSPRGDQLGSLSAAELFVSRVIPEPSAFITNISESPSRSDSNAMRRPSGDQMGSVSTAELFVSRVTPEPSAFITNISLSPSRSDLNAIRPAVRQETRWGPNHLQSFQ